MPVIGLESGRRPALLISEMQNQMVNPAYNNSPLVQQVAARGIIPKIEALAAGFRDAGKPVIYCTIAARPGFRGWHDNCRLAHRVMKEGKLVAGTPPAAIHDDLTVADDDIISARYTSMSPFTGTDLDATLRSLGVETIVFAGVSTNIALPSGAAEAIGLGYQVVLAEDCAAGGTAESHEFQIAMHLPLLATIASGEAVLASPAVAE